MVMGQLNTDTRILAVLQSGESMRKAVDPDGLTRCGHVSDMMVSMVDDGGLVWTLQVVFPGSESLLLGGRFDADIPLVTRAQFCFGEETADIPVKPLFRLLDALGNLSCIPQRAKALLVFTGERAPEKPGLAVGGVMYALLHDALFFGVEGADRPEYAGAFREICVSYVCSPDGICYSAVVAARNCAVDRVIRLSVNVDVYGLKGKSVMLEYNCGLGRMMSADCFVVRESRKRPSLVLAYDLAGRLGGLYAKERKKIKTMGKPLAQKGSR